MRFVAVFRDKQVSLPYESVEALQSHNDYRWIQLFQVVEGETSEELNGKVKESLRFLCPRKWAYRHLPEGRWCVRGIDLLTGTKGVLEKCPTVDDALALYHQMCAVGEFGRLSVGLYQEVGR